MDRHTHHGISVFFPVYNDAKSIGRMVSDARAVLERRCGDWEIILVNDGSRDGSREVVDALAAGEPRIRAVHHDRNRGYGQAIRTGFSHCTKDLIFYTDGDGQYDPRELETLLEHMDGADMVNGFKTRRADNAVRRFEGRGYHLLSRVVLGFRVKDVDCDFRLFRRHVVEGIMPLKCSGGVIGAEMMAKIQARGYRVAEVPVHHYPRPHGRSQFFRPRPFAHAIFELIKLYLGWVLVKRK
jgi:glycosyltransferase involved in cell wall biosynthesis